MNPSLFRLRTLVLCLGAGLALSVSAQQKQLEWVTIPPVMNAPGTAGAPPATIAPDSDTPQAKPVDPKYRAKIHTELAAAYFQAGNPKAALEETGIALAADPENVQAYSVQGLVHAQLKENAKAEADFQKALRIAPRNPDVNNNYGWFLCETGQPRQSIQYFLNALKDPLYETPDVAYANAGSCALKAGDLDGAQEYLLRGPVAGRTPRAQAGQQGRRGQLCVTVAQPLSDIKRIPTLPQREF